MDPSDDEATPIVAAWLPHFARIERVAGRGGSPHEVVAA